MLIFRGVKSCALPPIFEMQFHLNDLSSAAERAARRHASSFEISKIHKISKHFTNSSQPICDILIQLLRHFQPKLLHDAVARSWCNHAAGHLKHWTNTSPSITAAAATAFSSSQGPPIKCVTCSNGNIWKKKSTCMAGEALLICNHRNYHCITIIYIVCVEGALTHTQSHQINFKEQDNFDKSSAE